jgi:hypothetical protein
MVHTKPEKISFTPKIFRIKKKTKLNKEDIEKKDNVTNNDQIFRFLDNKMRKKMDRKVDLKISIVKGEVENDLEIGEIDKSPRQKPK